MKLFDSHCHLDFDVFSQPSQRLLDELALASEHGVSDILVPAISSQYFDRVLALPSVVEGQVTAASHLDVSSLPALHLALGLHPCFIDEHTTDDLDRLESLLALESHRQHSSVVAVGEIGLDFFIKTLDRQKQQQVFEAQLAFAKRFTLPVVLHVRKAHDEVLKQLRRFQLPKGGIVHAFSGSEQQGKHYIDLGFKLGFGGAITYERATKLRRLIASLPDKSWVLETDAPDMPLAGYAGQVNQSYQVARVAEVVSELRQQSVAQVALASRQAVFDVIS